MRDFDRKRNGRGDNRGKSFAGGDRSRRSFGRRDRDRGPRKMYKTVCDNCGKDCEVPFQPTSSKPVYCSDCFEKMGNGGRSDRRNDRPRFDGGRGNGGGNNENKALLESINAKLDKLITLLESNQTTGNGGSNSSVEEPVKPVKKVKKNTSKKTAEEK